MRHGLTPEALQNQEKFELIDTVTYKEMKPFIIKTIRNKSLLLTVYAVVQGITMVVFAVIMAYLVVLSVKNGTVTPSLKYYLMALGCSFTLLIPVHELLHALAFLVLGKRDIGFGMQLKQFIFYAEANRQVLNRKEITVIAFTPLLLVGIASILFCIFTSTTPLFYFGLGIFLIHFLFCAGDMAMVSYFNQQENIYSYDDRKERRSYFFKEKAEKS